MATRNDPVVDREDPRGGFRGLVAGLPPWFAVVLGIGIALAFFLAIWELWALADDHSSQQIWDRRQSLFQTLSSLFGAIVGAVFGVSVIQPRANRAERRADSAELDARMHAAAAAAAVGESRASVERARSDILRLAAMASWTDPEVVIDPDASDAVERALSAFSMAVEHPGPINIVRSPTEGGSAPVLALADLATIIEESRLADESS